MKPCACDRLLHGSIQAEQTWGIERAYRCMSQTRSFVRRTVHNSQSFIIASTCDKLPSTIPEATFRAAFRTDGTFSNCFTILLPRLLYKYWLMAAWVVDNFCAAATCEYLCFSINSRATKDRKAGSTYFTTISHGGRIVAHTVITVVITPLSRHISGLPRPLHTSSRRSSRSIMNSLITGRSNRFDLCSLESAFSHSFRV